MPTAVPVDLDLSNNSISLAGEFAVLSQLALRGYDANMTLGRTKSVDILVSDPNNSKMFKIEVKTHYRDTSTHSELFGHVLEWVMTDKNEQISDPYLFYVFVNIANTSGYFRYFIVPSAIVANYVKIQHEYWLKSRIYEDEKLNKLRKFRIGLDKDGYPIETPLADTFENKWEFVLP